jgi:hypothetical protein
MLDSFGNYINRRKIRRESRPWYSSYQMARQRCTNSKATSYGYYGGRGIRFMLTKDEVAHLWARDRARLLRRPVLDRINPGGDYVYSNCRFIEASENSRRMMAARLSRESCAQFPPAVGL